MSDRSDVVSVSPTGNLEARDYVEQASRRYRRNRFQSRTNPCGTATEIGADRAANVGVKRSTILACLVKNYGNWDKKRPVFLTSVSTTAKLTGRRGAAALDTLKKSQFNTIKIKYL